MRNRKGQFAPTAEGMSGTPEYNSWRGMITRCTDKKCPKYPRYGGRGIKVFEPWLKSFRLFLDHVGHKPSPELSIDRIDNDGNYEPGNVRWADRSQQSMNRHVARKVKLNGDDVNACEAARITGLPVKAIYHRIDRGAPDPLKPLRGSETFVVNGVSKTLSEWSLFSGIELATIRARLKAGWTALDAITKPLAPKRGRERRSPFAYSRLFREYTEGASIDEIAAKHRCTKATVYRAVARGKRESQRKDAA